ncbi:ABC transporter ATP-binding protein [candidate division KSB1 bacterium]|nr:ABC transporter ATP-binding protein [candidate division KSB1 bacterium]MBL7095141.1 ABC transporter ATP-binding protein [candidate division KSB1 bacterium]
MCIIKLENLTKCYGQVIGINNLSLSIESGVTGFLGPNGAGKSTLLKILTGQLKPTQGVATLWGEPVWNNYKLNSKIGYCPEHEDFYPHLTGYDFVFYMVRMHGFSKSEAKNRALKAIETVDMSEARNKRIGAYSKGMRQRIKLAQAIAHEPELLFLDEPLAGMDPLGRREMIQLIKRWGSNGKAVVVSSHILHEVEEMTNSILLINHGNIIAEGDIYEIRRLIDNHPLHVTIGCDNPNLLTSKLLEYDDVLSVQFDRDRSEVCIQTNQPDDFHRRLPKLALDNKISIFSLQSPDENLQSVFEYLVQ